MSELNGLLQRLSDAGIEFVVVGGVAAVLHGSSMVTRDLDVCATLNGENLQKLRDALKDLHPVYRIGSSRHSFLENPEPGVSLQSLYLQTDLGALDLLGAITGVGDFEQLIRAKEAVGRQKDLLTALELRAIAEKRAAEQ